MSADNYILIRLHPEGGFTPVTYFASTPEEENDPVEASRPSFPTVEDALASVAGEYTEYGIEVHPECSKPRQDALRKDIADLYARRHSPGGRWQVLEDAQPAELRQIISDDADAIMELLVSKNLI